ncbi:MAG: hypothetical protein NTY76_06185 [Candidatus Omnitrophica bacterium]|nr:hypothetical protein [Candidatus Omnitrophota bacterium]
MKNFFNRSALFSLVVIFLMLTAVGFANAGILQRNSGPSDLQKQELDDAYYRGYNDAKSGREAIDYKATGPENNGQVARGAGRGALGGAAIGSLSDGDAGKGAAWGAGAGAIKGVIKRRRAAQEEETWASQLSGAYNSGYRKGMTERAAR